MEGFKPGRIVRLRSGGPMMTVDSIAARENSTVNRWVCKWFNSELNLSWGEFAEDTLRLISGMDQD